MKLVFSIIILIYLTNACNDKTNNIANNNQDNIIVPLQVGNVWNYEKVYFTISKNDTSLITKKIVGLTKLDTNTCFKFLSNNDGTEYNEYYSLEKEGLYYLTPNVVAPFNKYLLIKYPCNIGEKFLVLNDTFMLESNNVSVKLKAGTFKCNVYTTLKTSITDSIVNYRKVIYYYSLGTGLVKSEFYIKNQNDKDFVLDNKTELVNFISK